MAIDAALAGAILEAVEQEGQPQPVGQRLKAWIEALAVGEAADRQGQFYENVKAALATGGDDAD